jgi:putative transposase
MGKHSKINLPAEQRTQLEKLTRSGRHQARVITRARILLLADQSQGDKRSKTNIAHLTQTGSATVTRICKQYVLEGLEAALTEKPRPGAIPKITGEIEAKIVLLACSNPPEGAARWTLSLLKNRVIAEGWLPSVSENAIGNRLKKTRSNRGGSNATASPKPARTS